MLDVSILSIGDELCIGQIINSNAAWIAEQITALGANVVKHCAVGDDEFAIKRELKNLSDTSEFIVITGGLGPTHDDITKPVLLDYFDDTLILDKSVEGNILALLEKRGLKPTELIMQMAMLPKSCKSLHNAVGTAPGMLFERNGKYFVSMPGVPNEMKYIMNNSVLPLIESIIKRNNEDVLLFKTLQTSAVPESLLAEKIGDVSSFLDQTGSLAFLPSYQGVRLRIGVEANNFEQAQNKIEKIESYIRHRVNEHIVADSDIPLSSVIGELLMANNKTVAVAESCTGGLLGAEFTNIPGSSKYFLGGVIAYSNDIKESILNVNHQTLMEYGAVSRETAEEMATNVRNLLGSDYGISITGIAGPGGGSPEKPVGTVWIGVSSVALTVAHRFTFGTARDINRQRTVGGALNLLYQRIKSEIK